MHTSYAFAAPHLAKMSSVPRPHRVQYDSSCELDERTRIDNSFEAIAGCDYLGLGAGDANNGMKPRSPVSG